LDRYLMALPLPLKRTAGLEWPRFEVTRVIFVIILLALAWLVVVPFLFIVRTSVTPDTLVPTDQLTLQNYSDLFSSQATYALLRNSLIFALGTNLIAI